MDKTLIPNLAVLVWALVFARFKVIALPRNKVLIGLMMLYIMSPFFTMLTNQEPLQLSVSVLPGMTYYDGLSIVFKQLIEIIPFIVGYNAFKTESDLHEVLKALVMAALAYSILILWEVRVSPQLHSQIYGFFPHSFAQQFRAGGFRAVVFLGHGLVVAIFVAISAVAAIGLWRNRTRIWGIPGIAYSAYLMFVLILCKSVGALVLAVAVGLATYLLRFRTIISILAISGLIIVAYPALRGANLIPINTIASISADFSSDRASSLQTRIDNEEILLKKAAQKPIFGWGSWGRDRVYKTHWTGKFDYDTTVTDGTWIIVICTFGWAGYIACFGILAYPTARAFRYRRQFAKFPSFVILLGVLVTNLFDLLPNSSLTPLTWLIAGALAGFVPRIVPDGRVLRNKNAIRSQSVGSVYTGVLDTSRS